MRTVRTIVDEHPESDCHLSVPFRELAPPIPARNFPPAGHPELRASDTLRGKDEFAVRPEGLLQRALPLHPSCDSNALMGLMAARESTLGDIPEGKPPEMDNPINDQEPLPLLYARPELIAIEQGLMDPRRRALEKHLRFLDARR